MIAAVARNALLGVATVVVVAGCGGQRSAHTPTTTAATGPNFNAREVARAFAGAGLDLRDPAPSSSSPHLFTTVTMLASTAPHDGWTVAAYIYPTSNAANASYAEDAGEWSASGIASVQVRNLVVVVIPHGHVLGRAASLFQLPKPVYRALGFLP